MNSRPPNLFIPGAAKSGTTTVADVLGMHPDVFMTPTKEPTFFSSDINYARGMHWYVETYFPNTSGYRFRGDASPSYLYFAEKVAPRMERDLHGQDIRFIVILRNPIDRAYSQYWHNVNWGLEKEGSFEGALQAEAGRLAEGEKEISDLGRLRYAYYGAGLYARQLRAFWAHFRREDFLLLISEDLERPRFAATAESMQNFLGIAGAAFEFTHSNPAYRPKNRGVDGIIRGRSISTLKGVVKRLTPKTLRRALRARLLRWNAADLERPPMNSSTRQMLRERYAAEIRELQELINKDLSGWLARR